MLFCMLNPHLHEPSYTCPSSIIMLSLGVLWCSGALVLPRVLPHAPSIFATGTQRLSYFISSSLLFLPFSPPPTVTVQNHFR